MTVSEAIHQASLKLSAAGVPAAAFDAELLLRHLLGRDRTWIVLHGNDELPGGEQKRFDTVVSRREQREPLQYINGVQKFRGLDIAVGPGVLIPRPETELVVEAGCEALAGTASPLVVDVCTGSGCIAVSIAREVPGCRVFALDRSAAALAVARSNAAQHGVASSIRFLEGDLFDPLSELDLIGRVDLITANPPYVRSADLPELQPEVRDFEPEMALVGGPEGTEIAERILSAAPGFLKHGGRLVMEMGMGQADAVRRMAEDTGQFTDITLLRDLMDIERVLVAMRK